MKNKKLILSVLSTAIVTSMATSALAAAPSAGLYLGGSVDKYYSLANIIQDEALAAFTADRSLVSTSQLVYVKSNGTAATLKDIIAADNINDAFKTITEANVSSFFGDDADDTYVVVGKDGKDSGSTVVPGTATPTGDLTVDSVSAITRTGVEITFPALAEAKTAATVEVVDNNGNTVAVSAQDLAKGETSATFDFVTALTADPTGKWTVNGTAFDFADIAKLDAILTAVTANNEVATLSALKAAGLTNVTDANITAYVTAIAAAAAADKDLLSDIQTIVNKVNTDAVAVVNEKTIVDPVVNATNQVELLAALQNTAFARVNASWIVEYKAAIDGAIATAKDTVVEIQGLVDGVNSAKITAADTAAATSTEQAAVTTLIQAYVAADVAPATTKADAIKASQVKAGVFKVKEASTQTSVYSALTSLAALDATNLPATALNSTLKADYLTAQAAYKATITGATTVANIKTNIVDIADAAALATALTGVDNLTVASTDAEIKAALQKLANVTSHKTGTDKFDMTTVKDASLQAYVNDATVGFIAVEAGGVSLAEVQTAISTVNTAANVVADLATVNNTASTAASVRTALIDIAFAQAAGGSQTAVDAFINLSAQAQLEVAQLVIDNRPVAPGYADLDALMNDADGTGAIATQQAAHATKLGQFNGVGNLATATTAQVKTALDTYAFAAYTSLTNTQKVAVAQQIGALTKTVSGTVTPLDFSGADAVTTLKQANDLITAAITAAGL